MNQKILDETPVLVLPSLAVALGLNEAIVIQQLHWALRRDSAEVRDGCRWVQAGLDHWTAQFPWWSETTIRRVFQNLRERHLVVSERASGGARHAILYENLASILDGASDHIGGSSVQDGRNLVERVGESSERSLGDDGSSPQLFEAPAAQASPPSPSPAKASAPKDGIRDELVESVWAHYVERFGTRLRIKGLTPARERTIRKALKAVGAGTDAESDDIAVNICHAAIDGLQSYRMTHPGSTDISTIFETGPHDRSNLTDKIEWWAGQAQTTLPSRDATAGGTHLIPVDLSGVPSVTKGRIQSERRHVMKMIAHPSAPGVQERGQKALEWIAETVGHRPIMEDGALRGWEQVSDG